MMAESPKIKFNTIESKRDKKKINIRLNFPSYEGITSKSSVLTYDQSKQYQSSKRRTNPAYHQNVKLSPKAKNLLLNEKKGIIGSRKQSKPTVVIGRSSRVA